MPEDQELGDENERDLGKDRMCAEKMLSSSRFHTCHLGEDKAQESGSNWK